MDRESAIEYAGGEIGKRVSEFFAEGTDRSLEEIEAEVEDLPMPDPLDGRPVDGA